MVLAQNIVAIQAFAPVNLAAAGILPGTYVRMAPHTRCCVIVTSKAASGTDTHSMSILESATIGGTGATAIALTQGWRSVASAIGIVPQLVTGLTSGLLPSTGVTTASVLMLDFSWRDMDWDGGKQYFAVNITDPGTVATIGAGLYLFYGASIKGNAQEAPMAT